MSSPQIAELRASIPFYKPLWEHSQLASDGRDRIFSHFLEFERVGREMIERWGFNGECNMYARRGETSEGVQQGSGGGQDAQEYDRKEKV